MDSLRCAALCLALCWTAAGAQTAATPKHSEESADAVDLMPRYLLQDVRGRVVTQESFRGRYQLISFGFISCPDVCPTTLLGYRNIIEALGNQAGRLQPLFITVDPERDHASVLREYTAAFHPAILGLRGSPELLQRAAQSFRVRYEKVREPGAAADVYTMDHSTGMYLLDGEGRFVTKFSMTANAQEVAARIGEMMATDRSLPASRSGKTPLR
jgi:protein SCO1/2